ncbi:class I SAM-dependent methyltransferase [Microtetraspora malaysiensis]|uniref:class I SAM-dependent methyltransferase n=1 Tax=Microtetraspora malaysiensis TaxID=161358 RepID=UPI003D9173C8
MRRLPFEDGTFDLVVSSLAVHNIPDAEGRAAAIRGRSGWSGPEAGSGWRTSGTPATIRRSGQRTA